MTADSLLIVLPLTIHRAGEQYHVEQQALNGLRLWADNFAMIILAAPVLEVATPPLDSLPLASIAAADRIRLEPLPGAWAPQPFLTHYRATARRLAQMIDEARYLHFAIGGFWGDWGAVAALIASRRGRRASVWTDRVESQVMRYDSANQPFPRNIVRALNAAGAGWLERRVIRCTALGLFHGKDTYNAYAAISPNPHVVHDIHLSAGDRITDNELTAKLARTRGPLKITYAGRVHPHKGPIDWIETCAALRQRGVPFAAKWHGDGPDRDAAIAMVAAEGLSDEVSFPGNLSDRDALLGAVRDADIFMFCHKTLESPRCLIEALMSGTPIVGYSGDYPADLIAAHSGGRLSDASPTALAAIVATLHQNRAMLAELTKRAALDGGHFVDAEVFRHRSDLIRQHS